MFGLLGLSRVPPSGAVRAHISEPTRRGLENSVTMLDDVLDLQSRTSTSYGGPPLWRPSTYSDIAEFLQTRRIVRQVINDAAIQERRLED